MKKYRAVIGLVFVLMCFLAACSPQKDAAAAVKTVSSDTVPVQVKSVSGTEEETTVAQVAEPSEKSVLVAYFSCTVTTKKAAEYAADLLVKTFSRGGSDVSGSLVALAVGADLYEIKAAKPYTEADLNYRDSTSRTSLEQKDASVRPAISPSGLTGQETKGSADLSLSEYAVIFLGYPIWNGQAPRIINTFLESYDFSGKTVVPFCTSGSSGIGSSAENLKGSCSDSAVWYDGTRFGSAVSAEDVAGWIHELDLPIR